MSFADTSTDRFQAVTRKWSAPVVLRAKHCKCGAVIIDRNLKRFNGMCEKCFTKNKAEASGKLASAQINDIGVSND